MRLTQPQRRRLFLPTWSALWAIAAAVMWLPSQTTWIAYGGGTGQLRVNMGLLTYVVIEREVPMNMIGRVSSLGLLRSDAGGRLRWYWNHSNLFLTVFATAGVTGVCWMGYRWSMSRGRLIGRCDECGYPLTGVRAGICPECGSHLRPASSSV